MKISILTPSYNTSEFLERAIKSVQDQDYSNWEHIVVDGGSSDGTLDILKKYPHLKWISEKDNGQSDAMNKAFRMATGDVISYLNADDYYLPGTFSKIIPVLQSEIDMVVGNLETYFAPSNVRTISKPSIRLEDIIKFYTYSFPLNPVSYFYKREIQENVGEFPISNHMVMDYWFLIRAFKMARIKKIEDVLGVFWVSGNNKSSDFYKGYTSLLEATLSFYENTGDKLEVALSSNDFLMQMLQKRELEILQQRDRLQTIYSTRWWRWTTILKKLVSR